MKKLPVQRHPTRRAAAALVLSVALALAGAHAPAQAQSAVSEASALSMLPVAISVAAPVALGASVLASGAVFTVVAVEASARGTVWVLERAADGLRISVTLASAAAAGVSLAVGTGVVVTALAAGWVLSAAGKAIAFIPNEMGKALVYNERVSR
jgi:hypothetical protein